MRMKRTMRSSSSTTRIRLRSKDSGMSFPHETDDLLLIPALEDFDQAQPLDRPYDLDHIGFKVMQILAVPLARIIDDEYGIGGFGQFVNLSGDRGIIWNMDDYCISH